MTFPLSITPTYACLGGPKLNTVLKLLPRALASPNIAGLSAGSDAHDALDGNFAYMDAVLAKLGDGQDFHWAFPFTPSAGDYATILVTPLDNHGSPQQPTRQLVPFDEYLIADNVAAIQAGLDHLDEVGMLSRLRSVSVSSNGFPTCEYRCDWGGDNAPAWLAAYPGRTLAQIQQKATDGQVSFAQQLDAILPANVMLVMSILDPGTFLGPKDDGAGAAAFVAATRAVVPARQVVYKYESLGTDGVVPGIYSAVGGPMAYQAHVGAAPAAAPDGAAWLELHIMNWEVGFSAEG